MNNKILQKRTLIVIAVTVLMMVAEIYYGITSHSMALTADGFHMGTHVLAFAITLIVCMIAIKYQDKTEKLNALGGYTSAILLGFTSIGIIWESVERFFNPLSIGFSEAILVAIIGLVVNLLCIFIMGGKSSWHIHKHSNCDFCENHANCSEHEHEKENLNYKAAYLHIVADVMTSVLAICALLLGKYFGFTVLDPMIGVFGGFVIAKWSFDLLKSSSKILLDFE